MPALNTDDLIYRRDLCYALRDTAISLGNLAVWGGLRPHHVDTAERLLARDDIDDDLCLGFEITIAQCHLSNIIRNINPYGSNYHLLARIAKLPFFVRWLNYEVATRFDAALPEAMEADRRPRYRCPGVVEI